MKSEKLAEKFTDEFTDLAPAAKMPRPLSSMDDSKFAFLPFVRASVPMSKSDLLMPLR